MSNIKNKQDSTIDPIKVCVSCCEYNNKAEQQRTEYLKSLNILNFYKQELKILNKEELKIIRKNSLSRFEHFPEKYEEKVENLKKHLEDIQNLANNAHELVINFDNCKKICYRCNINYHQVPLVNRLYIHPKSKKIIKERKFHEKESQLRNKTCFGGLIYDPKRDSRLKNPLEHYKIESNKISKIKFK